MVITKIKSCILSLVSFPVVVRYNNAAESVINLRARGTPVNAFHSTKCYKSYRAKNTCEMQKCDFNKNYVV